MFSSQKKGSVNQLNDISIELDDNLSSNLQKRSNQSDRDNEFVPIVNTRSRRIRILETSSDSDLEVEVYLTLFSFIFVCKIFLFSLKIIEK